MRFCDHVHVLLCEFTMDLKREQRAKEFCFSLGKLATETLEVLQQVYGNEGMN